MTVHRLGVPVLIVLTAAGLLAGCTGSPAETEPTPTAVAAFPEPVVLAGSGSGAVDLEIPSGAQSLEVRIACSEQWFTVSANFGLESDRSGGCGGMTDLRLPLSASSPMRVSINLPPESSFVAELRFSAEPLEIDPAVAENCEALSVFLSGIGNAERGFTTGDLDLAAWHGAFDDARLALGESAPTPIMASLFGPLLEWAESATEPGVLYTATPAEGWAAQQLAIQVCAGNGSSLILQGKYGG